MAVLHYIDGMLEEKTTRYFSLKIAISFSYH